MPLFGFFSFLRIWPFLKLLMAKPFLFFGPGNPVSRLNLWIHDTQCNDELPCHYENSDCPENCDIFHYMHMTFGLVHKWHHPILVNFCPPHPTVRPTQNPWSPSLGPWHHWCTTPLRHEKKFKIHRQPLLYAFCFNLSVNDH